MVGPDGRARTLGRRVPRLGRARRLPGHRPGRQPRAGCSGCRPRCCASCPTPGSPSAAISSPGSTAPPGRSSPRRGSASRSSRSAPSPPDWRTRSTTRPRPRPARSTRWRWRARRCCPRSAGCARNAISAEQFAALDALRREIEPPCGRPRPAGPRRPEQDLRPGWPGMVSRQEWLLAPSLAAAGVDVAWCERAATVLDGSGLEPGLEWVASTFSVDHAAVGGQGVDAADLRARRARSGPTRRWTVHRCSRST